ncbi:hypothetical protein IEQ_04976 [Bacillus cereus BAG6X1-2]|nr:hypothetical protein IEQ_04976 [Bacillus cereus BAG6X1-2]
MVYIYVAQHMYGDYKLQSVQSVQADSFGYHVMGQSQIKPAYPCDMWQYTDNGYIEGVGKVNINLLQGDKTLRWDFGK